MVAAMWSHTWNKYKLNVNFNGRIQGGTLFYFLWIRTEIFLVESQYEPYKFGAGDFLLETGSRYREPFDYVDDRPFNYNYATD